MFVRRMKTEERFRFFSRPSRESDEKAEGNGLCKTCNRDSLIPFVRIWFTSFSFYFGQLLSLVIYDYLLEICDQTTREAVICFPFWKGCYRHWAFMGV